MLLAVEAALFVVTAAILHGRGEKLEILPPPRKKLTELDKIIYERIMAEAVGKRSKNISIPLEDLYDKGFSDEEIQASIHVIAGLTRGDLDRMHDA